MVNGRGSGRNHSHPRGKGFNQQRRNRGSNYQCGGFRSRRLFLLPGEQGHLSDLVIGQRGKVLALHGDNPALKRHLLDMGITPGVEILVKKKAPLGDPIDIELRGYELCIRLVDMKNIDIEVIA